MTHAQIQAVEMAALFTLFIVWVLLGNLGCVAT